jgi:hypothetical protein
MGLKQLEQIEMPDNTCPATLDDLATHLDSLLIGDDFSLPAHKFRSIFGKGGMIGRNEIGAASKFAGRHGCGLAYDIAEYESNVPAMFMKKRL